VGIPVDKSQKSRPHIVIIGAGFAGLAAARALAGAPVRVTVVDRRNHHLFQPLLYQVATAALSAPDIAAPIRKLLSGNKNTQVLLAEATRVDVAGRTLHLKDGEAIPYDYLLLAAGAGSSYFGNDHWAEHAPGLKSLDDALEIRRRVLLAYEHAEQEEHVHRRTAWLTFVVVGAGPTGAEMAGALAEIARHTLARDFRSIDPTLARVVLVEGGPRVLSTFDASLSADAQAQLEKLGVEVRLNTFVTDLDGDGVTLGDEHIPAKTVVWAAGVKASPLTATLGAPLDRAGRVKVGPDLSIPDRPEVFALGDLAAAAQADGCLVPGVAQGAIQGGRHAARCILADMTGKPRETFRYSDKGSMATIGRSKAIAEVGAVKISGTLAWLLWLFVHVMALVGFRNRVIVLMEWAWAYVSWQRSARVILTEPAPTPPAP